MGGLMFIVNLVNSEMCTPVEIPNGDKVWKILIC